MKKILLVICCLLTVLTRSSAQEKITSDDVINIRYAAKTTIDGVPKLLQLIASNFTGDGTRAEIIVNSFQPGNDHQIFKDGQTTNVDNDIDQQSSSNNTENIKVGEYLNAFDSGFSKSDDPAINFTNQVNSAIKRNDQFTYILVKFDSQLGQGYPVKSRVALVEVEKINGKWKALIGNIKFYDSSTPIESTDNNVTVYRDTSSTSAQVSDNELKNQVDSVEKVRIAEEKRIDGEYNNFLAEGDKAYVERRYADAQHYYEEAQDKKPSDLLIDTKMTDVKAQIAHNTYDYLKARADALKVERRFDMAINKYQQAKSVKLDANFPEIKEMQDLLQISYRANALLGSKDYQGAIDECKKQFKSVKKGEKEKYPELYYIMAKAYEGLYIVKPENPGYKDGEPRNDNLKNAKKNYDLAVKTPNYIDALIGRANFYVRYLENYVEAISNYQSIINDATDEDSLKPGYYVTEGKWMDAQHNPDEALTLYTNAINISRRTDSLFFNRGELLYRQKMYDKAKGDFDMAIKLNPKYKLAYYYRGLNYAASKNNHLAGLDFAKMATLGEVTMKQKQTIDSLSNVYFFIAEAAYNKQLYNTADSNYYVALDLQKSNSKALHGQANIYFSQGQDFYDHGKIDDGKKSFEKSIASNKAAINFDPNFADAFYKEGLAQYKIQEYDNAVKSYDESIRSDPEKVDAFIERGNTYQTIKKYSKATESYDQAVVLQLDELNKAKKGDDKNLTNGAQLKLSLIYQLDGKAQYCNSNYVVAMTNIKSSLDNNAQNAEAFYYEGLINEAIDKVSSAIKNYSDALKVSADYRFYYARAKANVRYRNYQDAIDDYNKAIQTDTAFTVKNRNYLRGLSFFKAKRYNDASNDFGNYSKLEESKTDVNFFVDYGYVELYKTRDTTANSHFKMALASDPVNPLALYGLGCSFANSGNFDLALVYFEKSFKGGLLKKDDFKLYEDDFLDKLKDNKNSKNKYNTLKRTLLTN